MSQPTAQDIDNATRRAEIAEAYQRDRDECAAWAEQVFGAGYEPIYRHYLVDKDEEDRARREHDRMKPAATVFTAKHTTTGAKRHFMLRDGTPYEVASYEAGFGEMLLESHPTRGFTDKAGVFHRYHHYSLCFAPFHEYQPKSAEALAAARVKREERAVEKTAEALPLFAEQIREEGIRPGKRGKV